MTEIAKTIFDQYEIRKTSAQKTAFLEYVQSLAGEMGYSCRIEKGWLGARNLVIGNPGQAKVLYTAHYDTCPVLPFPNFITPRHMGLYLLYQLVVVMGFLFVPMIAVMILVTLAGEAMHLPEEIVVPLAVLLGYAVLIGFMLLVLAGPANHHTANDNTSGVITLLESMAKMPPELRGQTAYVFFDLEEAGLFGSMGFASRHKKEMKDTLVVNFDCVSDGETILLALQKKASKYLPVLEKAFQPNDRFRVDMGSKGVFYPSDQVNFPCGVGVAALKQTKRAKILYMDRIHTKRDTVYEAENIAYLADASVKLMALLTE